MMELPVDDPMRPGRRYYVIMERILRSVRILLRVFTVRDLSDGTEMTPQQTLMLIS